MITDKNKNITEIVYNQLNLPTKITFGTTGTIEYIYNAAGQKLEKIVTQGTTVTSTNYLSGFQYTKPNLGTWALQFFPTAEGYVKNTVVNSANNYSYVFNYTDHLGNVRLSYSDTDKNGSIATTEIVDESNYYPFGLKHTGYNGYVATDYKYKYNGKELQDDDIGGFKLNLYDYGARNYDPALGRWMNIDPLAEMSRRFSPYAYALNNPVYFIDVDGMYADTVDGNKNGVIYGRGHWSDGIRGVKRGGEDNNEEKEESSSVQSSVSGLNHAMHQMDGPDDNGYDENGNKVNDKGGDDTDYLYRDGKIIGSKKVFSFVDESSEISSDFRAYGVKIHTEGTGFDWTWDSVKDAAISVGAVGATSSKLFNTKITAPVFKGLGNFIKNYVPKLGANRYLRIGTSHSRGREVFRVTWGNNSEHLLDIDLGKIPKIK
jgi:RHS repeat-associated protein